MTYRGESMEVVRKWNHRYAQRAWELQIILSYGQETNRQDMKKIGG